MTLTLVDDNWHVQWQYLHWHWAELNRHPDQCCQHRGLPAQLGYIQHCMDLQLQKMCAFWKHGLTSKNIQSHLTYFCKSNINQIFTKGGGMIWGVRIAIFTVIRQFVEELITFLSIFGPQKLGILTARLSKSLSISTSIQWEGISVLKHVQSLHSYMYCENNSFWKTLWWDIWEMMHASKVSWIGITVCGAMMQSYLNRDYSVLQQNGRHAIVSYFQTDYTIVWFYLDVWYKHVFAEFWHRLGTDYMVENTGLNAVYNWATLKSPAAGQKNCWMGELKLGYFSFVCPRQLFFLQMCQFPVNSESFWALSMSKNILFINFRD